MKTKTKTKTKELLGTLWKTLRNLLGTLWKTLRNSEEHLKEFLDS